MVDEVPPARRSRARFEPWAEARRLAELVGLSTLAVAQPLLDVFGKAADAFLFRQADRADVVGFGLVVTLVPPLALWLAGLPFLLVGARARRASHLVALALLATAFGLVVGSAALERAALVVVLAAACAAALVAAYVRWRAVATWLALLALTAPLFLGLFLTTSPTAALLDEGGGAPGATTASAHPPVVMIVLDETPLRSLLDTDGGIDADLYPNLAALAEDATWFRNATTVAGSTWYAVPALLTGRVAESGATPVAADHPDNLFTALSGTYRVHATETLTRLCPTSICDPAPVPGVPSGLRPLLDDARGIYRDLLGPGDRTSDPVTSFDTASIDAPGGEADVATDAVAADGAVEPGTGDFSANQPARYAHFLDSIQPTDEPAFWYLHLLLPHEPWRFLPSGDEYLIPETDHGRNIFDWSSQEAPVALARQRHVLQVAYADALVGGVLDHLHETGLYDDAVIVVTADHGVAFTPGEPVRGTEIDADLDAVWPELMWVPLLVKGPGLAAGAVRDDNVLTTDVAPTIADLAGVALGGDVQGRSLLDGAPRTTTEKPFVPVEISIFGNLLGDPRTFDGPTGLAATLGDPVGAFLPDRRDHALRPYRLGVWGPLVGTPVADLDVGGPVAGEVRLTSGAGIEAPDASAPLDVLVAGVLDPADPGVVAVAVDGVVAGVAPTFSWRGDPATFAVLVPEALVRPGGSALACFRVEGDPDAPVLHPVACAP